MTAFFFKNIFLFKFCNFSTYQFFWFSEKNWQSEWKRQFDETKSFYTHYTQKCYLFSQKTQLFFKKNLKKLTTGFLELLSTCPEEDFDEIIIKKTYIFFGQLAKNFRTFGSDFLPGLSKLHSTCPEKHFEANFFEESIILELLLDFEEKL